MGHGEVSGLTIAMGFRYRPDENHGTGGSGRPVPGVDVPVSPAYVFW